MDANSLKKKTEYCMGFWLQYYSYHCGDGSALSIHQYISISNFCICSHVTEFNFVCFFFSSRRRHTRSLRHWSSDVCSSDLGNVGPATRRRPRTWPEGGPGTPTFP